MRFLKYLKNQIERGRLKKALRVLWRIWSRKLGRIFAATVKSSFFKRLVAIVPVLALVCAVAAVSAHFADRWYPNDQALAERLQTPAAEKESALLQTLRAFGCSDRIQVTVRTAKEAPIQFKGVDLDRGNINLVMTLKDGKVVEYPLRNKRIDNFESGQQEHFTLILPETVSVFDIVEYKLLLLPDAKGSYDDWYCDFAQVTFLLGGERTLLAQGEWNGTLHFSKEQPAAVLGNAAQSNAYYNQISQLYSLALGICEAKGNLHTDRMKDDANAELGLMNGDILYLDIETVGLEIQNQIFQQQKEEVDLSTADPLGYNGKMTLRVQFLYPFEGAYYKDYTLDTPGKDDFELGSSSTFQLEMPQGASVFDIMGMELLVEDPEDAWAPRLIRAYTRTDYGTALEFARVTDVSLTQERKTCVFYRGGIETAISPLALDLGQTFGLPQAIKSEIESKYYTEIKGVIYSMYFGEHTFYERQQLFYTQMSALYGEEQA